MPDVLLVIFRLLLNVIVGGFSIGLAIYHFKKKEYLRFGLQVMFAISFALFMAKIIFVG